MESDSRIARPGRIRHSIGSYQFQKIQIKSSENLLNFLAQNFYGKLLDIGKYLNVLVPVSSEIFRHPTTQCCNRYRQTADQNDFSRPAGQEYLSYFVSIF